MLKCARLDAPGTLHHVMIRGIERRQIVDDDEDRLMFVERLGELSQKVQMRAGIVKSVGELDGYPSQK